MNMKLKPQPFEMIKSGQKTIELRLLDEKRRGIKIGDEINFTHTDTGEKIKATVVDLHYFVSFKDLYKGLDLLKCGYTTENISAAHYSDMEQYYTPEEQKRYGVVGIEISLVYND